ncbi:MAG: hypothetical protein WAX85_02400 [Minisyncoccia bacterium]
MEKIKPFYSLILVVITASIFFALGRLYNLERQKTPIKIEYSNAIQTSTVVSAVSTTSSSNSLVNVPIQVTDGPVIGSKSGKKYYFPWCGTVKRILLQNQVYFATIAEARKAGFVPGGNCKGLK